MVLEQSGNNNTLNKPHLKPHFVINASMPISLHIFQRYPVMRSTKNIQLITKCWGKERNQMFRFQILKKRKDKQQTFLALKYMVQHLQGLSLSMMSMLFLVEAEMKYNEFIRQKFKTKRKQHIQSKPRPYLVIVNKHFICTKKSFYHCHLHIKVRSFNKGLQV